MFFEEVIEFFPLGSYDYKYIDNFLFFFIIVRRDGESL